MEKEQIIKKNPFKLGTGDETQDVEGWGFDVEGLNNKINLSKKIELDRKEKKARIDEFHKKNAKKNQTVDTIQLMKKQVSEGNICRCF